MGWDFVNRRLLGVLHCIVEASTSIMYTIMLHQFQKFTEIMELPLYINP